MPESCRGKKMKKIVLLICIGVLMLSPAAWSDSILDKIKEQAAKLKASSQPTQQSQPGQSGTPQPGGATNLHGLDDYNGCMAQAAGAQEKLNAQVLQRKLDHSSDLSPEA